MPTAGLFQLLHQHIVPRHVRSTPFIRRQMIEHPRGVRRIRPFRDQSQAECGTPMGRIDDKRASLQRAEIERGRTGLGPDAIKVFQPVNRGPDRPFGQKIKCQPAASGDDSSNCAGKGDRLALRTGNVIKHGFDLIRRHPGQHLPPAAMPRQPQECRSRDFVARLGTDDCQHHLADRIKPQMFRRGSECLDQALVNRCKPVE